MPDHQAVVSCRDLSKAFRSGKVLSSIHLTVPKGTILGLVGPNGAGKTTLLKILATLVLPTSGDAFVCGRHVLKEPDEVRRIIGYVSSEERSFFWRLRGRDNLLFFAALHGITGRQARQRIDQVLADIGLDDMGSRRFREYSTGMKQALSMARALVHDPPVLLLDEPTRSLSPDVARNIRELLKDQAQGRGKTILISSHDLKEVENLADSIAIIHHGVIQAIGSVHELSDLAGFSQPTDMGALFEYFTRGRYNGS